MRRFMAAVVATIALAGVTTAVPATMPAPAQAAGGALVTGRILDADGNPPMQTGLCFSGLMGCQTVAEDGSYSVQLPPGNYYPMVYAMVADGSGKYSATGTATVVVEGEMIQNFRLPDVVPVNLTLRESDGTPAANTALHLPESTAWVTDPNGTATRWMGSSWRLTGTPPYTTDAEGTVSFPALLGSTTRVSTDRPNTIPTTMPIWVGTDPTNATKTLPPMQLLRGRLTYASGFAIPDARVEVEAGEGSVTARTAQDGSYTFSVPEGPVTFEAGVSSSSVSSTQITTSVNVSGETRLDVEMPRTAQLNVHLRHSDGSPATDASVTRTTSSATVPSSVGTPMTVTHLYQKAALADSDGIARTRALAGADVAIDVDVPGQGTITGAAQMSADPSATTETTITFATASATVSGVVRDDTGSPVAGAWVGVRSVEANTGTRVATGADGTWSANVVPGEVTVRATQHSSLPSGGYSVTATGTLDVLTTAHQQIDLPAPVPFTIQTVDASDQPVAGVREDMSQSVLSRTMSGVEYEIVGGGFARGPSDASGNLPTYALPGSTLSGRLVQADGYPFEFSVEVPTDGTPAVVPMDWIGSVPSSGTNPGRVQIEGPPGTTLTELTTEPATTTPDGQTALVGNVGYTLSGLEPGSTNDIRLTLPAGSTPTKVFKVAEDGTTTDATDHASISGNVIVLHLTDGGFGDADGEANGVIVDPVIPTATPTPRAEPVTPATITGTARVGSRLTAHPGEWEPSTVSPTYQWLADGVAIAGATGTTYIPTADVIGERISVQVKGRRSGYLPGLSTSSSTDAVKRGRIAMRTAPSLSGTARVGHWLIAEPGTWTPAGVTVRYVWLRDGAAATRRTAQAWYEQRRRDRGHRISVRVIVSFPGYATRAVTTAGVTTR